MAKVNIKSEKITPFGEIYYASKAFYALSLDKVINGTLGVRSSTYNKRGARERDFDRLNNDFGWKHLPCSFLNETTVYMILTVFCMNFFSYFIRAVSSVFTSLSPTSRIKKLVFHFTAVCAKWTRTARSWWLNLYTGMPYDNLSFGLILFFVAFESQSQMGKGASCPNLSVFGFFFVQICVCAR